jgi:Ca2+-binding RTX toxin-like protein
MEAVANGRDTVSGGAGTDVALYIARTNNIIVTMGDNAANDGELAEGDRVDSDVENLIGGSGNDHITGSSGANDIEGRLGNDTIFGGIGNDNITGADGTDTFAGDGDDELHGGDGDDTLHGGLGSDFFFGENGDDQIDANDNIFDSGFGGFGDDVINQDIPLDNIAG